MKKAVFFDVDGTLISYSTNPGCVPEKTLEALRLLKDKGHIVALATGRSLITAEKLMRELGIECAVLCSGAHVLSNGETLAMVSIDPFVAKSIALRSVERGCDVFACTDRHMFVSNKDESLIAYIREQNGCDDMILPLDQMEFACIMNIYGRNLPGSEEFSTANVIFEKGYIEVRPDGVTKATGMSLLAKYFGISMRDTVAFGDGGNDVEMLRAAGTGVAVGNAADDVKAAADIVADPIDDGGIFIALKQLGLI